MENNSEKRFPVDESPMEVLHNLFEESATPRKEFVENLRSQVVSHNHTDVAQSNFISTLFMKFSQQTLRIGAMVAVLAIGVGAASYSYWGTPQKFANQDDILAKIAEANKNLERNTGNVSPLSTSTNATGKDEKMSALYIRQPENRDYNYSKFVNTYVYGKGAAKCAPMLPYQGVVTRDESVEYFSTKEEAFPKYSKFVIYAGDDIYDYSLNIDDEQWQFKGGSYAMHVTNVQRMIAYAEGIPLLPEDLEETEVDNKPSDDFVAEPGPSTNAPADIMMRPPKDPVMTPAPTDPKDLVTNYFGDGAKILGTVTKNGKTYYEVQWSYQGTCSDHSVSRDYNVVTTDNDFDKNIVVIALADSVDFSMDSQDLYLDSVSAENLLYTFTTEVTKKTVANFDEIKAELTFSYNVPVTTIDASVFKYDQEYRDAVVEYVKKNLTSVAQLTGKYTLQSIQSSYVTVVPDHEKHLIDRAYYSSKSYGEDMYNDSKDMFKPYLEAGRAYPTLQLSYSGTGVVQNASLSQLAGSVTAEQAIDIVISDAYAVAPAGTVMVVVGGQKVTAKVFEYVSSTSAEPGSTGSSEGSSGSSTIEDGVQNDPAQKPLQIAPREEPVYKEVFMVFTVDNVTVVLQTTVQDSVAIAELAKVLAFDTISTSDTATLTKILTAEVQNNGGVELLAR